MSEEQRRDEKVEEIFHHALERAPEAREAFLEEACDNDADLRHEVEMLLEASVDAEEGAILETNALGPWNGDAVRSLMPHAELHKPPSALGLAGAHEEKPGDEIGHYRLLQRIGEGGFGVVWMAEQRQPLRRRVALKIVKLGMDTKQVVARFEQERQALAMMDHPNIARVFDAGATPQGRPYFVMELVRGQRITDFCDEEKLPTAERLKLFTAVCAAVQHAHQKGIIHRDLKPSNILVTLQDGEPTPKVIDFGVAKATQQEQLTELTLFTQFEQMIGTPMYMAPEQAELSGVDIDTRCDIYALGVLLYELVAGRPPFDPETLLRVGIDEVRRLLRETEPPKPSTRLSTLEGEARRVVAQRRRVDEQRLLKAIRGDLDWIVMKAMEKSRHRRYDTANELAQDIHRHLEGDPVLARPPSRIYRLRRMARKHRVAWVTSAAVLLILVSSGAGVAWQGTQARREAESARETLALLRAGAVGYATEAAMLVNRGAVEQAVAKLDLAIGLDPDRYEYRLTKADILQAWLRFAEAAEVYRTVLAEVPHHPRAAANLALCAAFLERWKDGQDLALAQIGHFGPQLLHNQRQKFRVTTISMRLGQSGALDLDLALR